MTIIACANPECRKTIERRSTGRERIFCSDRCRQRGHRRRTSLSRNTAQWVTAESPRDDTFVTKTDSDINGLQEQKTEIQNASLYWSKANDVTYKLTDGRPWRTPASLGQWGGYDTERGLAWVIDVGWPLGQSAWYARCDDKSFGPTNFRTAKHAALALVTGTPLPKDEHAKTFIGPVDLHVAHKAGAANG